MLVVHGQPPCQGVDKSPVKTHAAAFGRLLEGFLVDADDVGGAIGVDVGGAGAGLAHGDGHFAEAFAG